MEGSARHALMLPTALGAPSLCLMTTTGTTALTQTPLSAAPTPLLAGTLSACLSLSCFGFGFCHVCTSAALKSAALLAP